MKNVSCKHGFSQQLFAQSKPHFQPPVMVTPNQTFTKKPRKKIKFSIFGGKTIFFADDELFLRKFIS